MAENEEWMECLMCDGRGIPQDFVTRSHDITDIIYYLRAERDFEIFKLTSFVTTNLINFEKIKIWRLRSHPSLPRETTGEPFHPGRRE
jgi:hypothetical protein